jgi:ATP-dependent Lon protease
MTEKTQAPRAEIITLPMIPLRDAVLFPGMIMPFLIGRDQSLKALEIALAGDRRIFLAAQHSAKTLNPAMENIYSVGTIGVVIESLRCEDGNVKVLIEGMERARILDAQISDHFTVHVKLLSRQTEVDAEVTRRMEELLALLDRYSRLAPNLLAERMLPPKSEDPGRLADIVVAYLQLDMQERQDLLETIQPSERLNRVLDLLKSEMDEIKVEKKLGKRVKRQMEKAQREYYLSEKMKAIQRELGQSDENAFQEEVQNYRKKIETMKLPTDAREKATQELRKLQMMPSMSAEATVTTWWSATTSTGSTW